MAGIQNFRRSISGFNREDVVKYIEYINNQHNAQIAQLNTQLQNAQEALARANAVSSDTELQQQLESANARIAALEEQLRQRGSKALTLEVRDSNVPAIALYEKLGFLQVGCRKNYYHNPREDALILRKDF